MSSVNNPNNLQPIDPLLTPPTTNTSTTPTTTTTPTQSSYYTSDIAPATPDGAAPPLTDSSSTPALTSPEGSGVSMSSYGRAMAEYVRKATDSSTQNQLNDIQASINYNKSLMANILEIQSLLRLANNLEQHAADLTSQYASFVDPVNAQISTFDNAVNNQADKDAIAAMNKAYLDYDAALQAYNKAIADGASGDALTAAQTAFTTAQTNFSIAATAYNKYITARNAQLPGVIDSFNQNFIANFDTTLQPLYDQIDEYNSLVRAAGGVPIAKPKNPGNQNTANYLFTEVSTTPPTEPLAIDPIKKLPIPPLPNRTAGVPLINIASPTAAIQAQVEQLTEYLNALVEKLLITFIGVIDEKKITDATNEYYKTKNLLVGDVTNPIIDNRALPNTSKDIFKGAAGLNAQGASSSDDLSILLNPSSLDFKALLKQATKGKGVSDDELTANANTLLRVISEQYLISAGMLGGKKAVGILGNDIANIKQDGNASKIAVALGFAKQLQEVAGTDVYTDTVQNALKKGEIPSNDDLVNKVVQDLRLNGALMSLFQIARAINTPGLIRQMIAAAGGSAIPSVNQALSNTQRTTYADVLNDPAAKQALKDKFAEELVNNSGFTKENAAAIAGTAVDNVAKNNNIDSETDLKTAFNQEFSKLNVQKETADNLSKTGLSTIKDEQSHPELILAFNRADLATAVKNDTLFTNQTIMTAVNETLKNPDITSQRQFRSELVNEFLLTGVDKNQGLDYANQVLDAIKDIKPQSSGQADPLQQAKDTPLLTQDQLKDVLFKKVVQTLQSELPVASRHQVANDLVTTLLGSDSHSVFSVLRETVETAQKSDIKAGDQRLGDIVQHFLAPRVELYVFAEALNDPANSLLYSAASGIMYSGNQSQKHENALQISV